MQLNLNYNKKTFSCLVHSPAQHFGFGIAQMNYTRPQFADESIKSGSMLIHTAFIIISHSVNTLIGLDARSNISWTSTQSERYGVVQKKIISFPSFYYYMLRQANDGIYTHADDCKSFDDKRFQENQQTVIY